MENLVRVDAHFWHSKRVFLTGHTGFKGSWLAIWLQHMGAEVIGFALAPPTIPNLFEVADVSDGMTSIKGDVRDYTALAAALAAAQPDIVIHLAAQSLVRYSYQEPVDTYATNVMGTVNLLDAVRVIKSIRAVLLITSDKCYQNREWIWGYREDEPMGGRDPYSSSKGCAELVTSAFRDSFFPTLDFSKHGVGVASARAGNVIGGGDWALDRLVPDVIRAFQAGRSVEIRNPAAVRPWQHVLEPLSGYLILAQHLIEDGAKFSEGWNFGPDDDGVKPVSWIVGKLAEIWSGGATYNIDDTVNQPHEAQVLRLDCSKARQRLDWTPRWTLVEALERVVDWHRGHGRGESMRDFSTRQIEAYTA